MRKSNAFSKILSIFIVTSMILSGMTLPWTGVTQEAYAKVIGRKNETQWQACDAINNNQKPYGYEDISGNKTVYRGGESYTHFGDNILDDDQNDFAKVLPYGNTYVDTSKLKWDNPENFIIDIQDDRFVWVNKDTELYDSVYDATSTDPENLKHKSTDDPMGIGKSLTSGTNGICYVGPLKRYLDNMNDPATFDGNVNEITPAAGKDYLYKITYLNAVILPDGTRGNLVLTMTKIQFETTLNVDADNPRVYTDSKGDTYSFDKAIVNVQGANELSVNINHSYTESPGNYDYIVERETVALTKEEATAIVNDANSALSSGKLNDSWKTQKVIRNAVGGLYDLDIEVKDQDGNAVDGVISYAAHDFDLLSMQDLWGHPIRNADGTPNYDFVEGMKIVDGSLSYAVVPNYDHSEGTTFETGWLLEGPGESKDSRLNIEPGTGTNANGVRFSGNDIVSVRGSDGTFNTSVFNTTEIRTIFNEGIASGTLKNSDYSTYTVNANAKKLLFKGMKAAGLVSSLNDITAENAWEYLKNTSWRTEHNDNDASFDTGFAVLLNAKKSSIQWSASRQSNASVNTALFDSSIYTYLERTHGTGGGIYLESYNLQDGCKPVMNEGATTMGRYAANTVTAVPEDGYRVNRILVGDTNYGHSSSVSGLRDYTEYVIDGNDIKVGDNVVGSFKGNTTISGFDELKTGIVELPGFYYDINGDRVDDSTKKIIIERNDDGTVDVTLPYVDNPMHVHVDFGADYYFYKVWVDGTPTELNLTASPAGIYPTEVTIPVPTGEIDPDSGAAVYQNVKFEINGNKYTAQGGTYKGIDLAGLVFTLSTNNTIEYIEVDQDSGEETLAIRPNVVLMGDKFVRYTIDQDSGEQVISDTYDITMENRVADWESSDAKNFKINNTNKYTSDGYVTELAADDPNNTLSQGNIVWKIKYPSEGVDSLEWPALPVEHEPTAANHDASNHNERNYWFVIEEVPLWSTEGYSNENAEVPGRADAYYHDSIWYANTKADKVSGQKLVHEEYEHGNAYMSVFENGGEITNVPSIIVRGRKDWGDLDNAYEYRKDIWLHIDAEVDGTPIKDVLPPQKVAFNASGTGLEKTWGNKKSYSTGDSSVVIVATAKKVPSNAKKQADGSYKYRNKTYWINELMKEDADGNTYEYSIRETLDRAGTKPVVKDNPSEGLFGYTSKDEANWTELSTPKQDDDDFPGKDTGEISGQEVERYSGEVKNTLETVEFTVKKVWKDGNNAEYKRPENGAVTYTIKKQSEGSNQAAVISSFPVEKSVTQGTKDITSDYANGKITVKTEDDDTIKFSNLPKTDSKGNVITYTVEETPISGYKTEITGSMSTGYTVTNTLKTEVYVEKEWGDANNQDGVRPQEVQFILKNGTTTVDTLDLSETTNWKGKFSDLDKYDENNAEISYSVEEDTTDLAAAGYTASGPTGNGTENNPYKIKNSRTPEKITIEATKVWDDDQFNHDNTLGIRFDAVFKLMGDGKQVGDSKTVATGDTHTSNMKAEWTVDKYRNGGIPIVYNVIEDKPLTSPYSVNITGDVENGLTVTNYYPPEEVEYITVTRTIVYTYIDKNGETASDTVTQTVRFKRYPTLLDEEGGVVDWTDWILDDEYDNNTDPVTSPKIDGWVADKDVDEWRIETDDEGNPLDAFENVIYTPLPPEGEDKVTYGPKGQPQTGKPEFKLNTPTTPSESDNKIVKYELLDDKGNPVESGTLPAYDSETGEEVGTYVLNDDGSITFTPSDPEYVGNPKPVTIKGTDSNGLSATGTYTPHLVDNTKTAKRTITYKYEDGTPVKDENGKPLVVVQEVTFTDGIVNPVDGKVTFPDDEKTLPEVESDPIDGYTVDRESVPQITVGPDDDINEVVTYSPKDIIAEPDETYGLRGQSQTGTPNFEMQTTTLPSGAPNELTVKLIDPNTGEAVDDKTVDALDKDGNKIGTYTLNVDGTVTFKPNDDFVGDPEPLELKATDKLGQTATTTYTPHVVDPSQKGTATRTIHFRYLTEDGEVVSEDVKQSVTLYKHAKSVDPKTGKVTEWDDWEPATFPAVENPDDKVDGKVWFTDDSVGELEVKEPGTVPDEYVIYEKIPYTVKYLNGDHGKSDGKGNQKDEEYNNDVTGGNGVTPNKGYKFTGKYTYVIKDHSGKVIGTGETDDPTSIKITGHIEFTPVYKKLPTAIYIDPATGRTIQKTLPFIDDNTEPDPPKNPKRRGYKFVGWERFEEYDENGELVNVRYEAMWEELKSDGSGSSKNKGANTGDGTSIMMDVAVLISAALAMIIMIRRRRKYDR